jgi:hypothetical protein
MDGEGERGKTGKEGEGEEKRGGTRGTKKSKCDANSGEKRREEKRLTDARTNLVRGGAGILQVQGKIKRGKRRSERGRVQD